MSESDADFEMLEKRLEALTPDESILVRSRAAGRPAGALCLQAACNGWSATCCCLRGLSQALRPKR